MDQSPADFCAQGAAPAAPLRREGNVYQVVAVGAFLVLAVGLVFGQTVRHGFIELDDSGYVYLNPNITGGLSWEAVKGEFTGRHMAAWMPLTSISHIVAFAVLGSEPGGHHLINVILHAVSAVLLFLVLRQMTGRLWPSALVAAIFAIHPLRVESVAWVVERKDVLSGLFFVLTLWAYAHYVRRPFAWVRYAAVVVLFALGLLAKPMLVTLPCVLLLLDYWPLTRWRRATAARLVLEKLPLVALVAFSCAMTIWALAGEESNVLAVQKDYALSWRIGNALINYVAYLGMFFYPAGLALPYPVPGPELPMAKVLGAALVLALVTCIALIQWRRRPYLLVGWLWYLGMLVPVSGVLQFANVSLADHCTYLPQIGLCLALVWALADGLKAWPRLRPVYGTAAVLIVLVLMGCAWRQTSYWSSGETLWKHTLACTSRNSVAHHALGNIFLSQGELDKAIEQYQAAIAIAPANPTSHYNLGVALAGTGRLDEAIAEYRKAVQLQPQNAAAHNNLANALLMQGDFEEARLHCQEALKINPRFAEAHFNLGNVWYVRGRADEAIAAYQRALESRPDFAEVRYTLGLIFANRRQYDDAIAAFEKTLETKPDFAAEVHNSLGQALAARGRTDEAMVQYRNALSLRPDFLEARRNLAIASRARGSEGSRTVAEVAP